MNLSIGWSKFATDQHQEGSGNSYFTLTPDEVLDCVVSNWEKRTSGKGETDLSRKVVVPLKSAAGFFIPVVQIVEGLPIRAMVTTRQPGEDPYVEKYIDADDAKRLKLQPTAAKFVRIVCYSAEALLENKGTRSTECDWEIVCVLASMQEEEPMSPLTMARNMLAKAGGTLSTYTAQEFAEAIYFHATQSGVKIKKLSVADKLREIQDFKYRKNECPHDFPPLTPEQLADRWFTQSAYCYACGECFGWRCKESPDLVCHYDPSDLLLDGSLIDEKLIKHEMQDDDDICIFCGQPDERQ